MEMVGVFQLGSYLLESGGCLRDRLFLFLKFDQFSYSLARDVKDPANLCQTHLGMF